MASEAGLKGADDAVFTAVEGEGGDSGAARRGDALKEASRPSEVKIPSVPARVEERDGLAGLRVSPCLFCSFAKGAMDAGEGEVWQDVPAARGPGCDMVDVEGGGLTLAGESTVFTAAGGTLRHPAPQ